MGCHSDLEDEIWTYYLSEEELEKLKRSLGVYLNCLSDPVKKLKAVPIVSYNLSELAQYLPKTETYPDGYESLLSEVYALLKLIREKEKDEDLLKLIDECLSLLGTFAAVRERYQQYYEKYKTYYPSYYYPKTKKEKYLTSIAKAKQYLEQQKAKVSDVDHLDFVVYDLASSAGHRLEDLLKERPTLDQAIVNGCHRLINELEREQREYEERLQLEAKIQELSREKQKLEQVKKELLDKCILALCQEWKEREQ